MRGLSPAEHEAALCVITVSNTSDKFVVLYNCTIALNQSPGSGNVYSSEILQLESDYVILFQAALIKVFELLRFF